jgi:hypothetical protein
VFGISVEKSSKKWKTGKKTGKKERNRVLRRGIWNQRKLKSKTKR